MIRIVICDDEQATETIIRCFAKYYQLPLEIVGVAHNGKEAVSMIRNTRPQIVFMDILMPYLSGFDVIEAVTDVISPRQIIIITAYEAFEFARNALRLGACDILLKPLDFDQMTEAVKKAVGWQLTPNSLVNRVLAYIHEHYAEPITLIGLAQQFFCSEAHLSREFKKHTGCSTISYLRKVRMQEAQKLLEQQPDIGIAELAERTGYSSISGFYQAFHSSTNSTPAAFGKNRSAADTETQDSTGKTDTGHDGE